MLHHAQSVEDFDAVTGRLPRKDAKDSHERTLGSWLYFQRACMRNGLGSRFQSLLNSSSALLRQRVEGWLSKDANCQRQCLQLKGYIEKYRELVPESHPREAAKQWNNEQHVQAANARVSAPSSGGARGKMGFQAYSRKSWKVAGLAFKAGELGGDTGAPSPDCAEEL